MLFRCAPAKLAVLLLLCNLSFWITAVPASKKPPIRPVDINSASAVELEQVPGIGPSTAEKILQMRKSYGAFKSVNDLLAIRGIGKKRLDKMRKYLIVGRAKAPPAKAGPSRQKPAGKP